MKKKTIKDIICSLILVIFLIFIFYLCVTQKPNGHYEGTATMQPDGNYYVWVEE